MKYVDDLIEYWDTGFIEDLEEAKSLINNALEDSPDVILHPRFQKEDIITEKPSYISDNLWDTFFVKDAEIINSLDTGFLNCIKLQSGEFLIIYSNNTIAFGLVSECEGEDYFRTITELNSITLIDNLINDIKELPFYEDDYFKFIYLAAKLIYGEKNVWAGKLKHEFNFRNINGVNNPVVFIKHQDIICKDEFGMKIVIKNMFSAMRFSKLGRKTSGRDFSSSCFYRDKLRWDNDFHHPHIDTHHHRDDFFMASVCQGSDSPINISISSYSENPTLEGAMNVLFNYNNLLENEDHFGGPYYQMRRFLKKEDADIPEMSELELLRAIANKDVNINVNIENGLLFSKIDRESLNNLVEGDSNNSFLHKADNVIYKKELREARISSENTLEHTYFYDQKIKRGYYPVNPDDYIFDNIGEDTTKWASAAKRIPDYSKIRKIEKKINKFVNNKIIKENEPKKLQQPEIEEELFGLRKIEWKTDSFDFVQTSTAD